MQTLYRLGNASALKLTTARWYTPSGRTIQRDRGHVATEDLAAADATASPNDAKTGEASGDVDVSSTEPPVEVLEAIKRPKPDRAKIEKCVKEWQIGSRRAAQIVEWLCEPFGDADPSGPPPAVLTTMPSTPELKPGERVIGVVVGVMPFGVFVDHEDLGDVVGGDEL